MIRILLIKLPRILTSNKIVVIYQFINKKKGPINLTFHGKNISEENEEEMINVSCRIRLLLLIGHVRSPTMILVIPVQIVMNIRTLIRYYVFVVKDNLFSILFLSI